MSGLLDALSVLGVPDVAQPGELEAFGDTLLATVDQADLDDTDVVARAATQNAPEFIALAEAAARAAHDHAADLLEAAASALPTLTNLVFLDAADVALNSPHLLEHEARGLAVSLFDRVVAVRPTNGSQAYCYLEALTRLGLVDSTARYRALELLTGVTLEDPDDLLERLPKLIGLAIDCWDEGGLDTQLRMLLGHDAARADATYELAQQTLRAALASSTMDEVMKGLTSARDQFTTVEHMEEARDDAALFRSVLDLTVAFVAGGPATNALNESADAMSAALNRRAAWMTRSNLGGWAAPRRQAEAEWYAVARQLREAIDPLAEESWSTPVETLAQVLAAYRASRSITVMASEGLRVVIGPTVESAFLARAGLLSHLRALTENEALAADDMEVARELLKAVNTPEADGGGDALGKAWAAAPDLAAELGDGLDKKMAADLLKAAQKAPSFFHALNEQARVRARTRAREADPVVDQLLDRVLPELDDCPDLTGSARDEFIEMLTMVFRFAADRANIGRMNGGPDVAYLFQPNDGKAFTEDYLQRDVATWFKATPLRRFVRMEEHDVAAGRADITVTQTHQFTIEVKRELSDASPGALLAAYGGQAAAYSVTGPSVSLEMVLDLTDQSHGTPSLGESVWVQEVPIAGGQPRPVVTIVIHGNRLTPRQMKSN